MFNASSGKKIHLAHFYTIPTQTQKLIPVIPFLTKKTFKKDTTEKTLHSSVRPFSLKYFDHQNYTRNLLLLGIERKL